MIGDCRLKDERAGEVVERGVDEGVYCVGIWVAVGLELMGMVVRYCLVQNFSMYGGTYSDGADALLIYQA
jgi:hypothetical protein